MKIAIVTGGGQGIGKGCAIRLANDGATVCVVDVQMDKAEEVVAGIRESGGSADAFQADVSEVESINRAVRGVVDRHNKIDILVQCAGVVQNKPLLEVSEADWDRVIDINEKGTLFFVQAVGKVMISQIPQDVKDRGSADRSYGKIVNFSSISGRRGREYHVHYAASKAAIISITQSAATAFARYNINVNAIAPSVVHTPMWEQVDREKAKMFGLPIGQSSREFIDRIPLKRAGTPADMAAAVSFLCSSDSDYITGQTLNVDGGYEMD